ncbi:MAG: 4Fe-4S binding protein [Clostridia bacterium]|nr:4Fe-4S binding protein [Clostridia bacterium]
MKRKIITIDEKKCNGCGLCVEACHEGALQLIDGKAKLVSEAYCDGLGDCLPECPTGAIAIEEREAAPYDEEAVKAQAVKKIGKETSTHHTEEKLPCGCPGTQTKILKRNNAPAKTTPLSEPHNESQLQQWPCQIKLVPVQAPYLDKAHLLIAADCTAYAYANIHQDFMRNKITLIGCPKLDDTDYGDKLTAILNAHEIKSITILKMEVPCCGGMVKAVQKALRTSGKMIPCQIVTISTAGKIIEE